MRGIAIVAAALTALLAGATGGIANAQTAPGTEAFQLSRAELLAKVAKTTDGLAIMTVPTGPDATVLEVHRDRSGEVEIHKAKHDVFVAHAGGATVLVGGEAQGGRETTPGEWRGGTIKAARRFVLAPGDVLWIPAGLPHQVIVAQGKSFNYLAIKFSAPPAP